MGIFNIHFISKNTPFLVIVIFIKWMFNGNLSLINRQENLGLIIHKEGNLLDLSSSSDNATEPLDHYNEIHQFFVSYLPTAHPGWGYFSESCP